MKTKKSALKRDLIIQAAAKIFAERNYADGTLAEIGEVAGTHAGSLYYYFSSKEALAEEVLNIATTSISDRVQSRISSLPPEMAVYTKIKIALEEHCDQLLAQDNFIVAYWKLIDTVPKDVRNRHSEFPRAYGRFWTALLKEGQDAGVIRAELNPGLIQLLMIGSTIYALDWFDPNGKLSALQLADALADMFFFGVGTRDMGLGRLAAAAQIASPDLSASIEGQE